MDLNQIWHGSSYCITIFGLTTPKYSNLFYFYGIFLGNSDTFLEGYFLMGRAERGQSMGWPTNGCEAARNQLVME